jgi:hypothetical protein
MTCYKANPKSAGRNRRAGNLFPGYRTIPKPLVNYAEASLTKGFRLQASGFNGHDTK